jgi:hypothetical protein
MVDDSLEDTELPSDAGRARRPPPTIDLDPADVSSETKGQPQGEAKAEAESQAAAEPQIETAAIPEPEPVPSSARLEPPASRSSRSASPWLVAPLSGAGAAALVLAAGWMLGWPPAQPAPAVPQANAAAIDELSGRVAALESKTDRPAASDAASAARIDALDKSLAALHGELGNLRMRSDKLAAQVNEAAAAPHDATGTVDLSDINERIARIERATQAQGAAIAQAKPADDTPLRRVVAAALLDVAVRHGDPYAAALAAAKSLSPDPDALKPLDVFAATGVPNPPALNRELLDLVTKLSPQTQEAAPTTGTGMLGRLQAGAAKLVRVERTDSGGNDRGAVVARVTAAALRNDLPEARRELGQLSPADRAAAQGWLDKAAARDAALATSRQFANDSLTALAKPAQ